MDTGTTRSPPSLFRRGVGKVLRGVALIGGGISCVISILGFILHGLGYDTWILAALVGGVVAFSVIGAIGLCLLLYLASYALWVRSAVWRRVRTWF